MIKILVINGPNLNMLGIREPQLYGTTTFADLESFIRKSAEELRIEVQLLQSNHEGVLIDAVQSAYQKADGILINPGGLTTTSVALLDALKSVGIPAVEVHLTDIRKREAFRQNSLIGLACFASVIGEGISGYAHGLQLLHDKLSSGTAAE
jgi:3-dehydroquinate dehydratase-2